MKHYFHVTETANYCGYDDEYIVEVDYENPKTLIHNENELDNLLCQRVDDRSVEEDDNSEEDEPLQISYSKEEITEEEAKRLNQERFLDIYQDDEI